MNKIKRIGVLTSGGDCAGLNAVIRAVVNSAAQYGWEVYGIHNGTDGITETPHRYEVLTVQNFSDSPWPRLSGSYLGSLNKGVKMESLEAMTQKFAQGIKDLQLDAIIVVGGDGSMNIVSNYCQGTDVRVIGVPKTIDNDTPITEFSVGFQTACQVCTTAIDSLELTARSHSRALILEVMGRDAGHLAMHSALAGGADVCLVPEIPYKIDSQTRTNSLQIKWMLPKDWSLGVFHWLFLIGVWSWEMSQAHIHMGCSGALRVHSLSLMESKNLPA